jgi:probable F420-dependent oxidoreductase
MKFGTSLPWSGPAATADNLRVFATTAEELGFDHVKAGEHLVYPREIRAAYPYTPTGSMPPSSSGLRLEMFTAFAFLAGQTSRLRFQPGVLLLALRSPLSTAKTVATLDYLSGGRLTLEVGVGWMKDEFDIAGVPFDRRGAIVDEYLAALRALFEDNAAFEGEFISFPPVIFEPKPVQQPMPVHLGCGASTAALRRVARFGHGWTPIGMSDEEVIAALPKLRELLAKEGRGDRIELELGLGAVRPDASRDILLHRLDELAAIGATSINVDFGLRSAVSIDHALKTMRYFAQAVIPATAGLLVLRAGPGQSEYPLGDDLAHDLT